MQIVSMLSTAVLNPSTRPKMPDGREKAWDDPDLLS